MTMPLCPYCHQQLPKFPSRKGNCPNCNHTYYVRTDPESKEKVVVDIAGVKRIEKIYHIKAVQNEFEQGLRSCTDEYDKLYLEIETDLTTKWMPKFGRGPGRGDVLWGLAGRLNYEYAQKSDFGRMGMVYFAMALYLHESGKDSTRIKQTADEMQLHEYKKTGIVKMVQIMAKDGCDTCKIMDGKTYSIEEALQKHLLPTLGCSFKLNDASPTGWCRCMYTAVI